MYYVGNDTSVSFWQNIKLYRILIHTYYFVLQKD